MFSYKLEAWGIAPGATVMRGCDWQSKEEDGRYFTVIIKVVTILCYPRGMWPRERHIIKFS